MKIGKEFWEVGVMYRVLRQLTVMGESANFVLKPNDIVELKSKGAGLLSFKVAKNRGRNFTVADTQEKGAFEKLDAEKAAQALNAPGEFLLPGSLTVTVQGKTLYVPAGELVKRGKPARGQVTYTWGKIAFTVAADGQQDKFIQGQQTTRLNFKGGLFTLVALVITGIILIAIITSGGNFMVVMRLAVIGLVFLLPILGVLRVIRTLLALPSDAEEE